MVGPNGVVGASVRVLVGGSARATCACSVVCTCGLLENGRKLKNPPLFTSAGSGCAAAGTELCKGLRGISNNGIRRKEGVWDGAVNHCVTSSSVGGATSPCASVMNLQ